MKMKDGTVKFYSSISECALTLWRTQGIKGFYAGFNANVYRLVIWNIIMFVSREQIKMKMRRSK